MLSTRRLAGFAGAVLFPPLLLAAAPAPVPAAAPGGQADEAAAVKAAVRALSDAVARGDARAVKAAVISDERTDELLDAMAALAAANTRFNESVIAKFGKQAAFDYAQELHGWPVAGDDVEKAEVSVKGEAAALLGEEGMPLLKKTDGRWKVDLTKVPPGVRDAAFRRIPSLQWLAWALDETSQEVSGGGHKVAASAHTAVEVRMRAALASVKPDGAAARKEEGDEARAARTTAMAMTKALLLGDARLVKELYAGGKDLSPALEVFTRLRRATQKLHATLGQRFPSLVHGSRPDQVEIGPDLLEAIGAARVTVDGQTAIVKPAGDWDAMMLRRTGPRWKVVLAPSMDRFLAPARATTAALNEAAAEVEAGKYESAQAFRAALAAKVQAAVESTEAPQQVGDPASRPAAPRVPRGGGAGS